jgi:hypothetical protein
MKSVRWKMYPSGWISLDYEYTLEQEQKFDGVSFDFPRSEYDECTVCREGALRVWKKSDAGRNIWAWEKGYNNTRTGCGSLTIPNSRATMLMLPGWSSTPVDGKFLVVSPDEDVFVRCLTSIRCMARLPHILRCPREISPLWTPSHPTQGPSPTEVAVTMFQGTDQPVSSPSSMVR